MSSLDAPPTQPPVPAFLVTRFARGRLLLWIILSAVAALLNPELLRELPRWVFTIWASWIAVSSLLVIALEYVLPPVRRPWLDALQACIDLPVIALLTWHAGAAPFLMAPCLAIPMASATGWLPKRPALFVAIATEVTMLTVLGLVAAGFAIPMALGAGEGGAPSRTFLLMVFAVQAGSLATIAYLQFAAVRIARDRRDRWQRLFDGAPDSIFVLDRNANVVRMNAAARRITGYSDAQMREGRLSRFTAAEDRERAMVQVNRALNGENSTYEARGVRADGSLAHVLVSNAPLLEDGVITGVLSIVHDMTDIRRAEQERRQMEQSLDQHRRLLQSIVSTVPTYLYVLDLRLRHVTFANDALLQMLGKSLEQLAALSREERFALYHPEDIQAMRHAAATLRRSGETRQSMTYRVMGADGEWRWLNDRVTVFERDADGAVTRLLGSAIDITEQKRVSAQLRFSDELYRTLIENYPGGAVILFDRDGRLLLAEGRGVRDAGLDQQSSIGEPFGHRLDAHTGALVQRRCRAALEGTEQQFELRLGEKIYDVRAVPVRDADGTIQFGMALTLDVTERRRLEADVRQSQKMEAVGTLAGGIAHDFNNILASIIGYAELAMLDAESEELQGDLQQVLTAAARGRQMVQRILAFSRRSGEELHPLELEPIISETLRLLLPTLPPGVTIDFHDEERVPAVLGDAGQLHQVVLNLCGNAIYAMRETGGVLTVRLLRSEMLGQSYLRLEVSDTGTGMTPAVLERALDPFFTTKPPDEGTGMGLAMVHGIVTGMGGIFRLESVLHRGTTAIIELPAEIGRPSPTTPLGVVGAVPTGTERVMVVDDEPAVAAFLSNALARFGYRTSTFTSGEAAIQQLADSAERYDLLITDMTMPRISGEDLLREALRLRPDLPVVVCTGYSASMSPERAYELGAAGYLSKPISINDLALQIRRILDVDRTPTRRT
ncbi:MAG: PAS domain S-box protein [Gemmatimonadaceae bacterium]|nr:PAS domain S-box protein [Gemmatimonadaceae bacterium]